MRKILMATTVIVVLLFTGCGQTGIGSNIGTPSVKQNFEIGKVVDQRKVMIDKGHFNTISVGFLAGATTGAIIGSKNSRDASVIGAAIGGLVGATSGLITSMMTNGNEVEAYEIDIESNGRLYKTYVEYDLPLGTVVEFLVRTDGSITNIDIKKPFKKINK